jgi:hypothetical protein
MGDLAFGKSYGNILGARFNPALQGVRNFMGVFGTLAPVPWFTRLGSGIAMRANGWKEFMDFTKDSLNDRIRVTIELRLLKMDRY